MGKISRNCRAAPHQRVDQCSGVRQVDSWNEKDLGWGKREEMEDSPD